MNELAQDSTQWHGIQTWVFATESRILYPLCHGTSHHRYTATALKTGVLQLTYINLCYSTSQIHCHCSNNSRTSANLDHSFMQRSVQPSFQQVKTVVAGQKYGWTGKKMKEQNKSKTIDIVSFTSKSANGVTCVFVVHFRSSDTFKLCKLP